MSAPTEPSDPAQHLQEILEREVSFRLQAIHNARTASDRIAKLEEELESTRQELGRRNTYIHSLHLAQEAERGAREELIGDLDIYSQMLQKAEDRRLKLERRSYRWSESIAVLVRAMKALVTSSAPRAPAMAFAPPGSFTYYFYTSPHRIFRSNRSTLRGWCYSQDGRRITALRARIDDLEFPARSGLEDPEVAKTHPALPADNPPGFEVDIPTQPGRHLLSLEACLDNREWRSVIVTPIWAIS